MCFKKYFQNRRVTKQLKRLTEAERQVILAESPLEHAWYQGEGFHIFRKTNLTTTKGMSVAWVRRINGWPKTGLSDSICWIKMKIASKVFMGFLVACAVLGGIMSFFWGRVSEKKGHFAADAPVRTIALPLPFPTDLIYQTSPDSTVLIGTHKREPALFDISAFDRATARKLWQLPFAGNVVGQTDRQLVVYEEKTSTVHFINPKNGQITRKISPEPAPLTSPSSLYFGMAFTDDLYITTKPLYQDIVVNGKFDTSWKIGITAKTWEKNEKKWFLPPVNQIIIIEHPPAISGNKMLVINPQRKTKEGHSYQVFRWKRAKNCTGALRKARIIRSRTVSFSNAPTRLSGVSTRSPNAKSGADMAHFHSVTYGAWEIN